MSETAWLNDLRPLLPGAVDTNIKQTIRSVVNEFCAFTASFVVDYPPINVIAGNSTYALPDTAEGRVFYLLQAEFDANSINIATAGKNATTSGTPNFAWFTVSPNTINFNTIPTSSITGGITLKVALTPFTVVDSDIPSFISTIHYQTILDGALGRMMKQPSKPWTDMSMARYHLQRFRIGMARARELTRKGNSIAELPWRFPHWA